MLSVTLRQLDYACAIARAGGLTAAAEVLHVSQPALSVALAQIEAQLGRRLFQRRAGGPMVPTPFGRAWLAEAERHLAGLARLMSGQMNPAPLRLAIFEELAPLILAPLLASTDLEITPRIMGFEALTRSLHAGEVDLALTWDLGLPPQTGREVLCRLPPLALMPSDHPLASRTWLCLADLAQEPLALTDQGLSIAHLRGLFTQAGLPMQIAHRCATLDLMRSFAANGLGIGISYASPPPERSPDGRPLVSRPLRDAGREPIILAWPGSLPDNPDLKTLTDTLRGLMPKPDS